MFSATAHWVVVNSKVIGSRDLGPRQSAETERRPRLSHDWLKYGDWLELDWSSTEWVARMAGGWENFIDL